MNREIAGARADKLRTTRTGIVQAILDRIDQRAVETQDWSDGCRTLFMDLAAQHDALLRSGEARGRWAQIAVALREAVDRLVSLGHDLELVLDERKVLARSGIDLGELFPPFEHDRGSGNGVRFEQDGEARLAHASGPDCLVAAPGELALDVPVKLTRPGATVTGRINVTLALATPPGRRDGYVRVLTRGAHFCPADAFSPPERSLILGQVATALSLVAGPVPSPPLPKLPLGTPAFYGGRMGELISLPATLRKRARRDVARLDQLRNWADAALKIVPDALIQYVAEEVRKNRASMVGAPRFHSQGFDITAVRHENHTRRLGCIEYGIKVKITLVLRCRIFVADGPSLAIALNDIDRDVDIDIKPDNFVTDLFETFAQLAADFIAVFLRLVTREMLFPLYGVRRVEVEVSEEHIVLHLLTREIPV